LASTYNDTGSGFSRQEHSSTLLRVGTSLICRIFAVAWALLEVANFRECPKGEVRRIQFHALR